MAASAVPQTMPATLTRTESLTTKDWLVPARPKPGRKPKAETANDDRRKIQNRTSQKKFRDKRAEREAELQTELEQQKQTFRVESNRMRLLHHQELETLKARHLAEMQSRNEQLMALGAQLQQVQDQLQQERDQRQQVENENQQMQRQLQQHRNDSGVNVSKIENATPTAVSEPVFANVSDDMEMDFTTTFNRPSTQHGDRCGFCTSTSHCACEQAAKDSAPPKISPGGCDACLQDPERARQCQELAQSAKFDNKSTQNRPLLPANRMTCNDFLSQVETSGRNTSTFRDVLGRVHAYPTSSDIGSGHVPALELDAVEAADALQQLSRGPTRSEEDQNILAASSSN